MKWSPSCLPPAGHWGSQLRYPAGRPHWPLVCGHAIGCCHRRRGALGWPPFCVGVDKKIKNYCHGGATDDQEETLRVYKSEAAGCRIDGTAKRGVLRGLKEVEERYERGRLCRGEISRGIQFRRPERYSSSWVNHPHTNTTPTTWHGWLDC